MTEPTHPQDKEDERTHSESESSVFAQLLTVAADGIEYTLSRVELVMVEAKVAATSVVWMLVLGLLALIIICSVWAVLNTAIGFYLMNAFGLSVIKMLGLLMLFNLFVLIVIMISIRKLANAIQFKESLQSSSTLETAK